MKRKQRKEMIKKGKVGSSGYKEITLQISSFMYDFLANFGMHGTCMCVLGSLAIIGMGFSRCDNGFKLALPFPNSHGVVGFLHLVELWIIEWFWNRVRWSHENSQGFRNPLTVMTRLR